MATDWTNRGEVLDKLAASYDDANDHRVTGFINLKYLIDHPTLWNTVTYQDNLRVALSNLYSAVHDILDPNGGTWEKFCLLAFLNYHTIAEAAEPEPLTWKDIIVAWEGNSDAAMMWTIQHIDQMRQRIWNKNPNIKWNENPFE